MDQAASPYHRAPRGVLTAKPVGLRLLPEEHKKLKEKATQEGRSLASQARVWMVRGMEAEETTPSTSTAHLS